MSGPLEAYRALLAEGKLRPDPVQAMAVQKLESLANAVASFQPSQGQGGWLTRFGFGHHAAPQLTWFVGDGMDVGRQGLYLYGDVGKGKSMLMDLFYDSVPVTSKKRVHFHEFMRDVQTRLHALRQDKTVKDPDPIPRLAREIVQANWLLCFDELQVTDIGDAMILGRLFQSMFEAGVVLMITSNRPPDDLYKDGLQRERFLPVIAELKQRLDILELAAERDYRMGRDRDATVFYAPATATIDGVLKSQFLSLNAGKPPRSDTIYVRGRSLTVPRMGENIAWFTFDELCRTALGPSDYLALASQCRTMIVSNVPILTPEDRDAARRFVTLIDALYEHNVHFICSAAAPPETLYPAGDGSFEFKRTVSRLMEMQSPAYLAQQHLP